MVVQIDEENGRGLKPPVSLRKGPQHWVGCPEQLRTRAYHAARPPGGHLINVCIHRALGGFALYGR